MQKEYKKRIQKKRRQKKEDKKKKKKEKKEELKIPVHFRDPSSEQLSERLVGLLASSSMNG